MMESICFYFMWKRTHFHMMESICFSYDGNEHIFHMMESICFYFMWKRTHFPLRDFIQQEVLKFSEKHTVN